MSEKEDLSDLSEFSDLEKRFAEQLLDGTKADVILNREGDVLPFGYYNPETEGKVTWFCGKDAEGKVTSVFCYNHSDGMEKKSNYLPSVADAINYRDILVHNGWAKVNPPKMTFTYGGVERDNLDLSRAEKRKLKKYVKRQQKKNPLFQKK